MDSAILEVALGMFFVFAGFALLASTLTESVTRFLGLRGEYLLRGIRSLVDGESTFELPDLRDWGAFLGRRPASQPVPDPNSHVTTLLTSPLLTSSAERAAMPAGAGNVRLSRKERRSLPSYISARSFARAVLDLAVPDASTTTTFTALTASVDGLPPGPLKDQLSGLVKSADGSVTQFRRSIEELYDDHMARVSGWYKRHVRWITLGLAVVLAAFFNVNAVRIATTLYTDDAVRQVVVSRALEKSDCDSEATARCVQEKLGGIPIGWTVVPQCVDDSRCTWSDRYGLTNADNHGFDSADVRSLLLLLAGYVVMVLAVLPGARFWFDLLGRFGSLRSTGPKPPDAAG